MSYALTTTHAESPNRFANAPSVPGRDAASLENSLLVGCSRGIERVRELVRMAAPSPLSVLIQGPTGAGKEMVAAALHALSHRRGNFVPFNVCAFSDSMFDDALFGHVRGAFTGALSDSPGLLREADKGTVFLDEISGLSLALQAKLLRAIETRRFRPVGGRVDAFSEFRVVAATNEKLGVLVSERIFREDLAHRIGAFFIDVPPLSKRVDDIAPLAAHFLREGGGGRLITDDALDCLRSHTWPGNVRELKQVIELSCLWSDGTITRSAVQSAMATRFSSAGAVSNSNYGRLDMLAALERHSWDIGALAGEMKVHSSTVYRQMQQLDISRRRTFFGEASR